MNLPITATFGTMPLETKAVPVPAVVGVGNYDAWSSLFGGSLPIAGPAVTPSSAMSVPAVASAVTLIAGALGSLPVKVYREADGGGRTEARDHVAFDLIHDDANGFTDAGALREQLVTDALLHGAGYGVVRRDANRIPVAIWRVSPETVETVAHSITGEPWFKINTGSGHELISHEDMIHVVTPCGGVAPIVRARDAISLAIALERHAARIFAKGARPSGVLSFPGNMTGPGVTNVRDSFEAQHTGEHSGKPAVVFGGATWVPTEFSTVDLQYMQMRSFQIHEIAKAFNVPPTLIGELAKATLSNSETMGRQFLQYTLMPWIRNFRSAYRRALITRDDRKAYSVDFVTDGFLQADSPQRAAFYGALRSAGCLTANEVRARENLPARPDGDSLASPHTTGNTTPALEASVV